MRASVNYGNMLADPERLQHMVQHVVDLYDANRNGTIEFEEYRTMMNDLFERLQFDEEDMMTRQEAMQKFKELDDTESGSLTVEELAPLVTELLDTMRDKFEELEQEIASVKEVTTDPKIFEEVVDQAMYAFDTNHDGCLNEEEMYDLLMECCRKMKLSKSKRPSREEVKDIFTDYDEDRNGVITKNELMHFLDQYFESLLENLQTAYQRLQI